MTDWESLVPRVRTLQCEDEVAGLAVSSQYIVCQFWVQPEIYVFCRRSLAKLRELHGHEYGGQSVAAQAPQQTLPATIPPTKLCFGFVATATGGCRCIVRAGRTAA